MEKHQPENDKTQYIKARYENSSYGAVYDNRYRVLQFTKIRELLSLMHPFTTQILDLGGGTGLFWEFLHTKKNKEKNVAFPPKISLCGIDLAWQMLSRWAQKMQNVSSSNSSHVSVHLICADAEWIPIRNDNFSSVIALTSLQNLASLDAGFNEIHRVMSPQAQFGFTILKKSISKDLLQKLIELHFLSPLSDSPDPTIRILESTEQQEDWIGIVDKANKL